MGVEVLLSCYFIVIAVSALPGPCLTPEGLSGTCIGLRLCPHYTELLWKYHFASNTSDMRLDRDYLLSWRCGSYSVCCPNDNVYTEPPPSVADHRNLGLLPALHDCGEMISDRIYGGNQTKPMEYPWMALITTETDGELEFTCAGTIINNRYILTAASCATQFGRANLVGVRLGEHDIATELDCVSEGYCADPVQDLGIGEVIPHPGYIGRRVGKTPELTNDIALIRLAEPANLTLNNVFPVCLPITEEMRNLDLEKAQLTAAGWGRTNIGKDGEVISNYSELSTRLLVTKLPFVTNRVCGEIFNRSGFGGIGFRQLCAGGEGGVGTCAGDSGAPLTTLVPSGSKRNLIKVVQYGIVSAGVSRCGLEKSPTIFTSVVHYMDWILDQLKP